jgi:hypothetical protein
MKKHILWSVTFPVCEMTWKNMVEPERPQMTMWCMRVVCCVSKAIRAHSHAHVLVRTHTHARTSLCTHAHTRARSHTDKCVTAIAFPWQQLFRESASVLRCTYIACLVKHYLCTRWFKYDRDWLCVNKSQFVPVIFEPPCTLHVADFSFNTHLCRFCNWPLGCWIGKRINLNRIELL